MRFRSLSHRRAGTGRYGREVVRVSSRRLGIVLLACQIGYGCSGPGAIASSATQAASPQPSAPASASVSSELKVAECRFLRQAAEDSRRLRSVTSPFDADDKALAGSIYGRTNSGLGAVTALVEDASRTNRVDDSSLEAYTAIVSVSAQLSAATLAVSPSIRPSYGATRSPDLVIADLALGDAVINSATGALSCEPPGG